MVFFSSALDCANGLRRRSETEARHLVKCLAELGFCVELKPVAAVS
jgi:hypothetical protein